MAFLSKPPCRRFVFDIKDRPEQITVQADDFMLEHCGGLGYLVFTVRRRRLLSRCDVVVATYPAAGLGGMTSEEIQ